MTIKTSQIKLLAAGYQADYLETKLIPQAETADFLAACLSAYLDKIEDVRVEARADNVADIALDVLLDIIDRLSIHPDGEVRALLLRAAGRVLVYEQDDIYRDLEDENPFSHIESREATWSWPVVDGKEGSSPFYGEFRTDSALSLFGYKVGKTAGWPKDKRQQFLSDFISKELPPIVKQRFGDEYGEPLTPKRLEKIATLIASFASLRLRNDATRYVVAIKDWEDDLRFLKSEFYDGQALKFVPWPQVTR